MTKRQEIFVREYLISLNATDAAEKAGYSKKTANRIGHELLQRPDIAEAVKSKIEKRFTKLDISADRILNELARIAFADLKKVMDWNDGRIEIKNSDEIADDDSAAIAEISETITGQGTITRKLRHHDKVRALELLGKYQKLFIEKHEHSGPDGKPLIDSFSSLVKLLDSKANGN